MKGYANTKLEITVIDKKLNLCFQIKDKTSFEHQHDLMYYVNCTKQSSRDNYVGETGRKIIDRIKYSQLRSCFTYGEKKY